MIAPVPVPPCYVCWDLSRLWRPWTWPVDSGHVAPFDELLHGEPRSWWEYVNRLPAALDPARA